MDCNRCKGTEFEKECDHETSDRPERKSNDTFEKINPWYEMIEEVQTPKKPSWQELWAKRISLTKLEEDLLCSLLKKSIEKGHSELSLSASKATCIAIVQWAKKQGISARHTSASIHADSIFETVLSQHRTVAVLQWGNE